MEIPTPSSASEMRCVNSALFLVISKSCIWELSPRALETISSRDWEKAEVIPKMSTKTRTIPRILRLCMDMHSFYCAYCIANYRLESQQGQAL